jgi:UPF0755 protein
VEATILASIVHKESVKKMKDLELPGISKSIELGMPLQADPTVIYALKLKSNDFDQVKEFL